MNSLEFINKEIVAIQTEIEHLKNAIRLKPIYADTFYECERGKECQARLNVLNQIKSELEAWEVVKEDIVYQKDIPCEERPEYTYEFKKWVFEINEDEYGFEEKSIKLKKALEVTNG